MKKLNWLFLCISTLLLGVACSDDKPETPTTPETTDIAVTQPVVSNITFESVSLSATISGSTSSIIKKGFCYATTTSPTIYSTLAEYNSAGVSMTVFVSGLTENTTYYSRAYVMLNDGNTIYSPETSFTTGEKTNMDELNNYAPPTYSDDYTSIAAWSQRGQWNLANVHDPTVMLAADGYFYMCQTDASYGNAHAGHGSFHMRRSRDLVNWEYMGATMTTTPAWVKEMLNEYRAECGLARIDSPNYGYWAPVIRKINDQLYRMYYSIVIDNNIDGNNTWGERAFIGLAETTDPASNQWEDKGFVVCSSSDKGTNWANSGWETAYFKWNAIDPTYIATPAGEHWLIYGSWHSGIVGLQINPSTGKPIQELTKPWGTLEEIAPYGKLLVSRSLASRWQGSEGPEIIYNPDTDYYYLFMAYDALGVPYNTRVCRSKNIDGPYYGIDGRDLTASGGEMYPVVTHPYKFSEGHGWVGISHCAVFDDGAGNWYYASQGRLPENISGINASNAVMMGHIRSIRWTSDGWPVVMPQRYGAVPAIEISESELIGNWECIDLSYQYGQQKQAATLTLGSNNQVTAGIWKGSTWTYNKSNQTLTINGIELCLQREVDWERTPRTHTLVFAGYQGSKTYWGKKSK